MNKRSFQRHLRTVVKQIDAQITNLPENAQVKSIMIRDQSAFVDVPVNATIPPRNQPRREWQESIVATATVKMFLTAASDNRSDNLESENDPLYGRD